MNNTSIRDDRGTSDSPALAVYQNKLFMAWKGKETDPKIYYSVYDGNAWSPQQLTSNDRGTSHSPALAVYQNKLFMAWKGKESDPKLYYSVYDGNAWSSQKITNSDRGTSDSPALAVYQNKLFMAWKGKGTDVKIYYSAFDGSSWSPQLLTSNDRGTSHSSALAVYQNKLFMAWKGKGTDVKIYYSVYDGNSWSPQQLTSNDRGTSHSPSLSIYQNDLIMAWKGKGTFPKIYYSVYDGSSWSPQQLTRGDRGTSHSPSIAMYQNKLFMAWKGKSTDPKIYYATFDGSSWSPQLLSDLTPNIVDLSKYLYYIRQQGAPGCWAYALMAAWDIMNEIECPYSPNLSMRIQMMLHSRRDIWEQNKPIDERGIYTPDGRWHPLLLGDEIYQSLGNTTEGVEPTSDYFPYNFIDGGWSSEGINEAENFRLEKGITLLDEMSITSFIHSLAENKPVRIAIGYLDPTGNRVVRAHYVTVVGYDKMACTFTYVNSSGDRFGTNGYETFTFDELNENHMKGRDPFIITDTEDPETKETKKEVAVIKPIPPKPMPVARICIKHSNRRQVRLTLKVEDSPLSGNHFWPNWREIDNSENLHITVRLPEEFIWPPSENNRLLLELHDTGSLNGGSLVEFFSAFGDHVIHCSELKTGPIKFNSREHRYYVISG